LAKSAAFVSLSKVDFSELPKWISVLRERCPVDGGLRQLTPMRVLRPALNLRQAKRSGCGSDQVARLAVAHEQRAHDLSAASEMSERLAMSSPACNVLKPTLAKCKLLHSALAQLRSSVAG